MTTPKKTAAWPTLVNLAEVFVYNEVTTTVSGNLSGSWFMSQSCPTRCLLDYADRSHRRHEHPGQPGVRQPRPVQRLHEPGPGGFHDYPRPARPADQRPVCKEIVSAEQIDEPSFLAATTFTKARNYYFDGAITDPINIRQWGADTARDFLLDLIISNGKFALQPLVDFDSPEQITGLFTAGNILEDSFELTYFDQDQRQPPRVSVSGAMRKPRATSITVACSQLSAR